MYFYPWHSTYCFCQFYINNRKKLYKLPNKSNTLPPLSHSRVKHCLRFTLSSLTPSPSGQTSNFTYSKSLTSTGYNHFFVQPTSPQPSAMQLYQLQFLVKKCFTRATQSCVMFFFACTTFYF